jgi:hypothetical protein
VLNIASCGEIEGRVISTHFYAESVIRIKMRKFQIGALIDSGASISCIQEKLLEEILPTYEQQMRECHGADFTTAGGSKLYPAGTIQLQFMVEDTECDATFYVFKNLDQQVILGRTFLTEYQAKLDFENNTLEFQVEPQLMVETEHTLKPGEVCLIKTKCDPTQMCVLPNGLHGEIMQDTKQTGLEEIGRASCRERV